MDFELLERVWRSNANRPSEAASAYLMEEMMQTLNKRRRDFRGLMVFAGLALMLQTGLLLHALAIQKVMDLSSEWGAFLMLALGWGTLVAVGLQFQRHLHAYPDPEATMAATLRALIDENLTARRRLQLLGIAGLLFFGATAISLIQLQHVGKMSWGNVRDFTILFGGGFLAGVGYAVWRYFRVLKPEGERLERLHADYRD